MPARQATTLVQRHEILRLAEEGHSFASIAEHMGVSFWTARKWIRRGKRVGDKNLASCYGRPASGALGACDPLLRYVALRLKKQHPKWGAAYVRKKLGENSRLRSQKLPSATTIWRYWRSFGARLFPKRDPPTSEISPSDRPHGVSHKTLG